MQISSSRRRTVAAVVFVVFLTIQITIPTLALFEPRPTRFGWQMFSGARTQADFVVVYSDGRQEDVVPADYLGHPRLESDVTASLPAFICATQLDAAAVRIEYWGAKQDEVAPCRR